MSLHDIASTLDKAFTAAGLDTHSPRLAGVQQTIRQALSAAGLLSPSPPTPAEPRRSAPPDRARDAALQREPAPVEDVGRLTDHVHAHRGAERAYRLYVPARGGDAPRPLVVMLHGCKQNPDDFAAGTRMNALADEHGFVVAWPAQTTRANGANCWNWFERAGQSRGGEEPALLAGIVGAVAAQERIDPRRVFVAGLSAGAAMAVNLGATYPEVFAAVGVHSGLPHGAAHDVGSAFAAMQGREAAPTARDVAAGPARPTIVFHGDADATVVAANAARVTDAALRAFEQHDAPLLADRGVSERHGGRDCRITRHRDEGGVARVEQWLVHGGSHAWFGGSPAGSFTEPDGPDASAEMVRFFLAQ